MAGLSALLLYQRLSEPGEIVDPDMLARKWQYHTIKICVQGLGAFVDLPGMLNKIRGSLGEALLASASDAVKQEHICPWSPCCAAEVLFAKKPEIAVGIENYRAQIPKPFVLAAERYGSQDLLINMTVFGMADYWVQVACEALVEALHNRVHWHKLAAGEYFVPAKTEIGSVKIRSHQLNTERVVPDECRLSFITPLDTERTEIAANPHQVLKKLLIRVALTARWQGASLASDLDRFYTDWLKLDCRFDGPLHTSTLRLESGRNKQSGFRDVTMSELAITGDIGSLWPFLLIGEITHIGRGAVRGLGRFHIGVG